MVIFGFKKLRTVPASHPATKYIPYRMALVSEPTCTDEGLPPPAPKPVKAR